ncbi:hypothetical protein ACFL13_01205 [Patescibacteria group bacterium]
MIIVFSGVDGSGKTTLAHNLVNRLKKEKTHAKYVYMGNYFILTGIVKFIHYVYRHIKKTPVVRGNPLLGTKEKPMLSKCWLFFSILENLLVYMKLKILSILGIVVISDRYFYDRLLGLEYHGYSSKLLSQMYLKMTPRPTHLFMIDVDEEVSLQREVKEKHPLEFYKCLRQKYMKLATLLNAKVLDGNMSKEIMLEKVMTEIKNKP